LPPYYGGLPLSFPLAQAPSSIPIRFGGLENWKFERLSTTSHFDAALALPRHLSEPLLLVMKLTDCLRADGF
jgi:hypothetical protein